MQSLHQRLHLYTESNDTYIFVPAEEGISTQSLTVHRSSGDIVLNRPNTPLPTQARRSPRTIYGIVGLISLSLSEYIIVITGRELRGRLMGHEIYRAADFDILPLNPYVSSHNPPHPVEGHLLALIRSHLREGNFLFGYGWDLTRRLQAQWEGREKDAGRALWEVTDDRFFWNRFLQTRLIDITAANTEQNLSRFILPLIYGTFDLRPAFLHGRHIQLCLISRRSRFRAGTRYFRRGIDHEGHVANFNETEQLLLVEGPTIPGSQRTAIDDYATKLSFVQIRGSVPLFWAEVTTLRYKPDLQIMDLHGTADAMQKHLQEQVSTYGDQSLVNLVNQRGREQHVKEAYERYVSQIDLPRVHYQHFDFHNECKNMRWDRISVLIDRMKDELDKQGYFQLDTANPSSVKYQQGIVRTNCMDNLDRTNVVQASLAKWTINKQLRDLKILPPDAGVDDYEAFSKDFREMWADHADAIATAYGGSGALKSDFTRTNKRTRKGLLEDGVKSVIRYIKNNYFDGARQDAFDLVTGVWIPRKNPAASMFLLADTRPLITRSMPVLASFSMFMICAGFTLPRSSDYSIIYYFIFWFSLFTVALLFILFHGIDYVSWPRLLPLTDVIFYSGPGFRSAHNGKGFKGGQGQTALGKQNRWLGVGKDPEEVEMGTMKKRTD
ncbi:inositol/phosphatidylinositol phosphatase [Collybia nuda]|uniref:Inositol/phosphatidylinositol phosphatase n=1 Tax=Collybia nuda TaxID=64659 RepID=A0A9P5XZ70_9AGAR|nr:inositol/phosphatidylinositol phosphatase [Collybia nuda]